MTKVVFETATIADAVKKAALVAPAKGAAFDKAAGVLLEAAVDITTIKATNLEIFYTEWIDTLEVEGDPVSWRLPASLFASILGSLPIGSGKTVTLHDEGNVLHMNSGRTRSRFNLLPVEYYPVWTAFDPDNLTPVQDLGGRIAQVHWACSKAEIPITGVHFDGEWAIATDRYRLARVPMPMPLLDTTLTVPGGALATILKQTGEVSIGIEGGQFLIMPDEHTQVRAIVFAQDYPKLGRVMVDTQPQKIKCNKTELLEIISRANLFAGSDRFPSLRVFIGVEEIAVMMAQQEKGLLGDVIDVTGYANHDRVEIKFTPKNIIDALTNAPNEEVWLGYDPTQPAGIFYVDGGSGYQAWVMPRREGAQQ